MKITKTLKDLKSSHKYKQKHKRYQAYVKRALAENRKPVKFKDYETEPVYFSSHRKPTVETRLKRRASKKKNSPRYVSSRTKTIEQAASSQMGKGESLKSELAKLRRKGKGK